MRYDLHTHSNCSDGVLPPAEVVARAARAGLDGIALTDHDTTRGLDEARAAGGTLGIDVLVGCEVSAGWRAGPVHVLAYFVDPGHPRWVEELRWITDDRVLRAEKIVERLSELGSPVTMAQVLRIAGDASVGRPHIAQAMVEVGTVPTTLDAFTPDWIADGGRAYVPKRVMGPHDTVELIIQAGGVAVMAHPIWIERDGRGGSEALIEECAALGMAGIEVEHPDHTEPDRQRYRKVAERLGLIATGASDFHGNLHGGGLGTDWSSEAIVEALRARAGSTVDAGARAARTRDQAG